MALPVSPNAISLGQVNTELGISPSTTEISLNQAAVRALFVMSSGQISMSDGHGKSASSAPVVDYYDNTPYHFCYSGDSRNMTIGWNVSAGGLPITVYLQRAPVNTCSWTYANNGSAIGTMTSLGSWLIYPSNHWVGGQNMAFRLILVNSSGTTTTGGIGTIADYCTSDTFCSYGDCVNQGQPGCYNCSESCWCDPCTYDTNCDCSTGYGSNGCDASCDCGWCDSYYIDDDPFTFTQNPDWPCPCSCQLCSQNCTCPCGESCAGNTSLQTCEDDSPGYFFGNSTSSC